MRQVNILLLFLSDIKVGNEGKVKPYVYENAGQAYSTNESAVRYLYKQGVKINRFFVFVTDKVKKNMQYMDKNKEMQFFVNDKGVPCSHFDYFKESISDICENSEEVFVKVDFNEQGDPLETMHSALTMAEYIREYVKGQPVDFNIKLHADCTGGMRNANMMMMALMRIIQYSGINIGFVVYSNFQRKIVEDARSIYDLFDLVSGAEEFANFGSVNSINRYFEGRNLPESLKRLLEAMQCFAEEIRLCHSYRLQQAAKVLRQCLLEFKNSSEKGIEVNLMHQLEYRLERDYAALLEGKFSSLNLIQWCLEHDHLQQALTLYVEYIPEYLMDQKLVEMTSDPVRREVILKKKSVEYSDNFYFMVVFVCDSQLKSKEGISWLPDGDDFLYIDKLESSEGQIEDELVKLYKELIPTEETKVIDMKTVKSRIDTFFMGHPYFHLTHPENVEDFFHCLAKWQEDKSLLKCPDKENKYYKKLNSNMDNMLDNIPYGRQKYKKILNYLKNAGKKAMELLISGCKIEYAYRFMTYLEPELSLGKTNIPKEKLRQILNAYGYFKNERNNSNHAREEEFVITADDLKEKMTRELLFIRDCEAAMLRQS